MDVACLSLFLMSVLIPMLCQICLQVGFSAVTKYKLIQVKSKVIWQTATLPTCHPLQLRMNSSDLDPI